METLAKAAGSGRFSVFSPERYSLDCGLGVSERTIAVLRLVLWCSGLLVFWLNHSDHNTDSEAGHHEAPYEPL